MGRYREGPRLYKRGNLYCNIFAVDVMSLNELSNQTLQTCIHN